MNKYIFYKKLIINKKTRNIYKKSKSNKLFIRYKNNMINLKKYKKIIKSKKIIKKKGGFINGIIGDASKHITDASRHISNGVNVIKEPIEYIGSRAYRLHQNVQKNVHNVLNNGFRHPNPRLTLHRQTAFARAHNKTNVNRKEITPQHTGEEGVWVREQRGRERSQERRDRKVEEAAIKRDWSQDRRGWGRM